MRVWKLCMYKSIGENAVGVCMNIFYFEDEDFRSFQGLLASGVRNMV